MRKKTHGARWRTAWILTGILVFLLVVAAVIMPQWAGQYLRSPAFRATLEREVGRALHAEVIIDPLRWSGPVVYSGSLEARGHPCSVVQSLRASEVRATIDWRAAFGGIWRVEGIDAIDLNAVISPHHGACEEISPEPPPDVGAMRKFLPSTFDLGPINAKRARITIDRGDEENLILKNAALTFRKTGSSLEIDGSGGELKLGERPEIEMDSFRSRVSQGVFFLTEARGRFREGGKVSAHGEFSKESRCRVEWEGLDVTKWIHQNWAGHLTGRLAGTADIRTGADGTRVEGTFLLTEGLLQNIETLDRVAKFTGSPQFRRMPLQHVSGKFATADAAWTIDDLVLESKGLLKATGSFRVSPQGDLEGNLEVGVGPQVLQWIPGSRERVFTTNRDGYVWTPVRLGGTLAQPKEDLSVRLTVAAQEEVIETGVRAITDPAGTVIDGARGILDRLVPLLE